MNLGPHSIASTYPYILNQSGSYITLGNGSGVNWNITGDVSLGENANNNYFGLAAVSNDFGGSAQTNYFGLNSQYNHFGNFGSEINYFGSFYGSSYFRGICSILDTGRMRLANFTGASSQSGLRGELRVSGSGLYVCTGANSGWGRVFLSSF